MGTCVYMWVPVSICGYLCLYVGTCVYICEYVDTCMILGECIVLEKLQYGNKYYSGTGTYNLVWVALYGYP